MRIDRSRITQTVFGTTPRRDAGALLAIAAVWLLFYWRLFAPNAVDRVQFPSGDFTQQFLVFRSFAFDELRGGRLPLWIPCIDSGYPYQADPQSALFYPIGLLNVALNLALGASTFPLLALELESALHVLLAALLMYAFLRGETRRRAAALVGALVFAFGGYLTGYPVLQMAIVEAAAWLPLALWGARRLAARGDMRSVAFTTAPLALSVLAGHPQTTTFMFYTVALYALYRARRERASWRAAIARLALAVALAVALSAVQLLPSIEYVRHSTRAELSFTESGAGFPPADVIQFLMAGVVSHFSPLYAGLLPLALVGVAVGPARKRDSAFWALLGVGGLLLSFGRNLAAFDPVYWLAPGYSLFRDQERHALIVASSMSVLSAYGADAVLGSMTRRARAWLRGWLRWLGPVLVLLIAALAATLYLSWRGDPAAQGVPDRLALSVMALGAALAVLSLRPSRSARRWLSLAVVAVVGFDLATANRAVNWAAPSDPFPLLPSIQAIQSDAPTGAVFRIHNEQRLPGHALCMSGLGEVGGITPIRLGHYGRFAQSVPREIRWSLLNVRYVVTYRNLLDGHLGQPIDATRIHQEGEGADALYVFRLADDHPRAWIVHQVETLADREAIFAALSQPGFDPRRLGYTHTPIVVEANAALEPVSAVALEPKRLVFESRLATPGLLVVSEVNYPGWVVYVNGVEMPIVEVDGLLRGVALGAGSARVEFHYRPAALIVGAVLSGLGVCAWVMLAWIGGRIRVT